ncbi:MAG: nucleotidyltransferase domain-containing protein [Clostridiales Family XIII bacterium]|jgi:hypothetical protein|nr:nucleotidyltransferase domain-containing protein [Clostridiales Family XIII bacterium]
MATQEAEFLNIIKLFADNNCLKDVVLIGSWATYLYQRTGVIPQGTAPLRTLDVDFLIRNLRKPAPPVNLETLAIKQGYVVDHDRLLNTTKIRTASRLEIEFLIPQRGSGHQPTYKSALGVTAQGLRHVEILRNHTIDLEYLGFAITVPTLEAYILHKMAIQNLREADKKVKDREAILALFPYIDKSKYNATYEMMTKKEKRYVDEFACEYCGKSQLRKKEERERER